MARGRMVSKALSTSQKFARLNTVAGKRAEFCQLLFPLLVAHADDYGRQSGDTFTVKHAVVPTSPRKEADVAFALQCLHDVGLVVWYEIEGRKYLEIVDFDKHQTGLHKRTTPDIPAPSGKFPEIPGSSRLTELNRTEQNLTEGNRNEPRADVAFMAFWSAYPEHRRKNNPLVQQAFVAKCAQAGGAAVLMAALENHKGSEPWRDPRYIPAMSKWLDDDLWRNTLPARSVVATHPNSKTAGNVAALQSFVDQMRGKP